MAEEQYDVLDARGNKTGQVLSKSQVHDQELWHASAFVWIYNSKGEVLLQLRSEDKRSFPGVWDVSVAGHMSAGDKPEETAIREIEEEIGIKVTADELTQIGNVSDIVPWLPDKKHPEFCWVFVLPKDVTTDSLNIQTDELNDIKWISIDQLEADLQDPERSKQYAARNPLIYKNAFKAIRERLKP